MARGRRPRAVHKTIVSNYDKTEGTVFPNMDLPRPANNMFIFFFQCRVLSKQFLS